MGIQRAERQIARDDRNMEGLPFGRALLPALGKVYDATGRLDRHIAALRCVEAIRLHAAAHGGKLPSALSDITEVPVPMDPVTDRPFEYEVKGATARLTAPLQDGDKTPRFERLTYEITLRR